VFETDFGATILIGATGGLMMFVGGAVSVSAGRSARRAGGAWPG
jgi:hypothetical protein